MKYTIYTITNKVNGMKYVGKTSLSLIQRFNLHIKDSKNIKTCNRPLYQAFNSFGIENFDISELEIINDDDDKRCNEIACERERYWIECLNTYIGFDNCNGYNATYGGNGKVLYDHNEIINTYNLTGSVKETVNKLGCCASIVSYICNNYGINTNIRKNSKCIERVDCDGNKKIYESITIASVDIKPDNPETARKNISRALNKCGIAYGFSWNFLK